MLKHLLIPFLILLILAVQLGFLPGLGSQLSFIVNFPLLFLLFVIFFTNNKIAIGTALIMGLLLDIYASTFFGFFILILLIEVFVVNFFRFNVFQDKSLGIFLLINIITIFIWHFVYLIVILLLSRFSFDSYSPIIFGNYLLNVFYQMVVHTILILLFLQIIPKLKRKLRSGVIY